MRNRSLPPASVATVAPGWARSPYGLLSGRTLPSGSPPPRRRKRPHRFASCRLRAPARASRTSALARHMWAALWDRSPGRSRHACPLGRAELRRAAPSPRRPTARSPCKTESPSQRAPACRATSATPNLWVLRRPDREASRSTEGFRRDRLRPRTALPRDPTPTRADCPSPTSLRRTAGSRRQPLHPWRPRARRRRPRAPKSSYASELPSPFEPAGGSYCANATSTLLSR